MLTRESSAEPLTIPEFDAALGSLARFENRPFLAVAVSGGPDSLALAILADRWARERRGEICALTVDHRLRPESRAEVEQLRSWLSARAIRHEVLIWSGGKPTTGIQEAARIARYRLLAGWCREHGCLHLLTAHHRDDQIETHLIRRRAHSGRDGLAGMSAIRELADCRLMRPLLAFPKDRLVAFLNAEGQPFVTDPSNANPTFERSRLRRGAGITSTTEFSDLPAEICRFGARRATLEHELDRALAQSLSLHPAGFAVFDPGIMRAMSNELAERMLNAIVATIGGTRYPSRRERIARLRGVLDGAVKRAHTLGGCRFAHWRDRVLVMRELASAAMPARLTPGERIVWDRRFEVILPAESSGPAMIGYLGAAAVVQFNRRDARRPPGPLPRLLFPILPATWDEDGIISVPHLGYRRDEVSALPQFLFRPVNPLTQAGFVVV